MKATFNPTEEAYIRRAMWEREYKVEGVATKLAQENNVYLGEINLLFCKDVSQILGESKNLFRGSPPPEEVEWPWPGKSFKEILQGIPTRRQRL